jgi:hypothetical protein
MMALKPEETPDSTELLKPLEYRRSDDFMRRYSNNTFLEGSVWDLKILFGELDQKLGTNVVTQHTAVTLSWAQAKVLFHFLRVHLAGYEAEHGRLKIPKHILTEISSAPPENVEPHIWEAVYKAYKQTLTENPGTVVAPPKK